ncbi:glycosyltransferase family 2 protein [Sphingobium sp. EM0848]|uniref:glycosyltransferase family 2 protein n=1 Tax=Sphingobium sp. EM0848 TaxID=2743473 RepID=UPI00159C418C|nr:glycosyltransferase [Sphingobium sp. EM0848]
MTFPRISVIIPHYNDLSSLGDCLDALEAQSQSRDSFEIIVADNGSPIDRAAMERVTAGRARLVTVAEKGAGPARNGGVAASRGPYLAFVDCDCTPHARWLEEGVVALERHDLVGGRMVVTVDRNRAITGPEAFESVFAFDNRRYVEEEAFTVTANLFCPRRLFDEVGGFRNGVSEDKDWCHRARDAGYRIGYAEQAMVGHPARVSWDDLRNKWRRLNAETYGLFRPKPFGTVKWVMRNWLLPLSIAAHVPTVLRSPALRSMAERRAALATLVQIRLWRFVHAHQLAFGRG